jgi:hypothetical protein
MRYLASCHLPPGPSSQFCNDCSGEGNKKVKGHKILRLGYSCLRVSIADQLYSCTIENVCVLQALLRHPLVNNIWARINKDLSESTTLSSLLGNIEREAQHPDPSITTLQSSKAPSSNESSGIAYSKQVCLHFPYELGADGVLVRRGCIQDRLVNDTSHPVHALPAYSLAAVVLPDNPSGAPWRSLLRVSFRAFGFLWRHCCIFPCLLAYRLQKIKSEPIVTPCLRHAQSWHNLGTISLQKCKSPSNQNRLVDV